jgi:osmotically-inducible protein OsmY
MLTKTSFKHVLFNCATLGVSLLITTPMQADNYQSQAPYYQSQQNGYRQDANRNDQVSDQELIKKVHDKISSGWLAKGYEKVTTQVFNGSVTLQGSVPTWDDKEKLEKEIRNIEGVKNLNSQLRVEQNTRDNSPRQFPQDTYANSVDDQLNKKIRDNVSAGWFVNSYKEIALHTSNGIVTLDGTIDNADDQQKLVEDIQKIQGVKAVRSNLRIKNR